MFSSFLKMLTFPCAPRKHQDTPTSAKTYSRLRDSPTGDSHLSQEDPPFPIYVLIACAGV